MILNKLQVIKKSTPNDLFYRLFRTAKEGKQSSFVELIKKYKVWEDTSNINEINASRLIFGYQKLNLDNELNLPKLEKLLIEKHAKMNCYDMCMSGWGLQNSKNQQVKEIFSNYIQNNWNQIKLSQRKPNIGFIALILNNFGKLDLESLKNICEIFLETLEYQDIRNLSMILTVIGKNNYDKYIFNQVENFFITHSQNQTEKRNKIAIIYQYAKAEVGSDTLWETMEKNFNKLGANQINNVDLLQLTWSFGHMMKGSRTFWLNLIQILFDLKQTVRLQDLEALVWALSRLPVQYQECWDKLLGFTIPSKLLENDNVSDMDELLNIAKILYVKQFENTVLFKSLKQLFIKQMQKKNNLLKCTKLPRFYYVYINDQQDALSDQFIQDQYDTIMINYKDNKEVELNMIQSLAQLFEYMHYKGDKWSLLLQYFLNLQFDRLQDLQKQNFIRFGINLFSFQPTKIIETFSNQQIQEYILTQQHMATQIIKLFGSFKEAEAFFRNFIKAENVTITVFYQLVMTMLALNNFYFKKDNEEQIKRQIRQQFYRYSYNIREIIDLIISPNQQKLLNNYDQEVVKYLLKKSTNVELNLKPKINIRQTLFQNYQDIECRIEQ
ncbi:hypothetical protein pb186bvf_000171 [Paramecium bursaria]